MQVQSVRNNQNFEGRIIIIGNKNRIALKNFARTASQEIKSLKDSEYDVYIGTCKFLKEQPKSCTNEATFENIVLDRKAKEPSVSVIAMKKPLQNSKKFGDFYFREISTVKDTQILTSEIKKALKEPPVHLPKLTTAQIFKKKMGEFFKNL
jgi:hypothetical protein